MKYHQFIRERVTIGILLSKVRVQLDKWSFDELSEVSMEEERL